MEGREENGRQGEKGEGRKEGEEEDKGEKLGEKNT